MDTKPSLSAFFNDPEFLRVLGVLGLQFLLHADVTRARAGLGDDPTEYFRRQYIRAVFAELEGLTFSIKLLALAPESSPSFSTAEMALLRGEQYRLSDTGDALVSPAFLTLSSDMKFAIRSYAKSVGLTYQLPVSEPGWSALLRAKKVRDRLMHPRSANDLQVTDDELECATQASEWFQKKFEELSDLMMDQVSRNNGMSEADVSHFRDEREEIVRKEIKKTVDADAPPAI
jgi:hypothetical protein